MKIYSALIPVADIVDASKKFLIDIDAVTLNAHIRLSQQDVAEKAPIEERIAATLVGDLGELFRGKRLTDFRLKSSDGEDLRGASRRPGRGLRVVA
ncbi:hypothetical protein BV898_06575 [Hypsibius exemplaris]|uniref:Uncharacterized protein n=1 Tax=Hypsibius exemplaris TaxID=2072580 RepID=A0A1W0WVY9_HYPEX|nr:hypothetical protein BV898_06575 [Hypsibius exemplaris]